MPDTFLSVPFRSARRLPPESTYVLACPEVLKGMNGTAAQRVYCNQMARRLLAFALAFVVIGSPLAADICDAVCAEHAGHFAGPGMPASHHHHGAEAPSQTSYHHHSDVTPAPTTSNIALTPMPRACGHSDAVVTESHELMRAPIADVALMTARATPLLAKALTVSAMDSRHGPPAPIRSTSPLRV
jgi:hypothetical protein